jgi:hypothetical protein
MCETLSLGDNNLGNKRASHFLHGFMTLAEEIHNNKNIYMYIYVY